MRTLLVLSVLILGAPVYAGQPIDVTKTYKVSWEVVMQIPEEVQKGEYTFHTETATFTSDIEGSMLERFISEAPAEVLNMRYEEKIVGE